MCRRRPLLQVVFVCLAVLSLYHYRYACPRDLTPQRDIEQLNTSPLFQGVQRRADHFALVLNLVTHQTERMLQNMQSWDMFVPCQNASGTASHLVFYVDGDDGDNVETTFARLENGWNNLATEVRDCFGHQSPIRIIYRNPDLQTYPDLPCAKFYNVFQELSHYNTRAFFNMEPDANPIRTGWLQALRQASAGDDWWQKGSYLHCQSVSSTEADFHFNGASLFRVGRNDFDEYRRRVQSFPVHSSRDSVGVSGSSKEFNFQGDDLCMYWFRRLPSSFIYARTVAHQFQVGHFVINMCREKYDRNDILRRFPRAYIVHSSQKSPAPPSNKSSKKTNAPKERMKVPFGPSTPTSLLDLPGATRYPLVMDIQTCVTDIHKQHLPEVPGSLVLAYRTMGAEDIDSAAGRVLFCIGKTQALNRVAIYFWGYPARGTGEVDGGESGEHNVDGTEPGYSNGALLLAWGMQARATHPKAQIIAYEGNAARCNMAKRLLLSQTHAQLTQALEITLACEYVPDDAVYVRQHVCPSGTLDMWMTDIDVQTPRHVFMHVLRVQSLAYIYRKLRTLSLESRKRPMGPTQHRNATKR